MGVTVAGKPQAQSVLLAPGYRHPEGSLCQSRQRIDATHRFPLKFHDLPGCFSVRHRWNVDGEHVAGVQTGLCALQFDQRGNQRTCPNKQYERCGDLRYRKEAWAPIPRASVRITARASPGVRKKE
jgi:hypothetical protein